MGKEYRIWCALETSEDVCPKVLSCISIWGQKLAGFLTLTGQIKYL